jgi:uncharacterized lipoprotein
LKKSLTVVACVLAMLVTAGCNPFRRHSAANEVCKEPDAYASAKEGKTLIIPAGLESPDTRNALRVPDLSTAEPPARKKGEGCLDEPPSYTIPKPKQPES